MSKWEIKICGWNNMAPYPSLRFNPSHFTPTRAKYNISIDARSGGRTAGRAPVWVGSLCPAGRAYSRPRPDMGRVIVSDRVDARSVGHGLKTNKNYVDKLNTSQTVVEVTGDETTVCRRAYVNNHFNPWILIND